MFSLLLLWIGALIRLFRSRGNLAPATTRCARRAAYRTNTDAIRFCEKLLQSLRESPNIRAAGGLLRFARPFIDSRHKEVKSQASEEYEPGENRGRENCPCVTCKESFQGNQIWIIKRMTNECHCSIDGHESASLLGTFEIGHISFPLRLPQGGLHRPFRQSL